MIHGIMAPLWNSNSTDTSPLSPAGASGIGLACALGLAKEDCIVALWDVSRGVDDAATKIAAELDVRTHALQVDVRDSKAVESAVRQTEATLGPIAHVVHAAAIGSGKFGFSFTNLDPSDWPRVLEVNILGTLHVAQATAAGMIARKAGTFVFIASVAGQIGSQTDPPYSASKAANINFAQCLAKDLAPHNIRVNTVNPSMVRTPLNQAAWTAWNDQQSPGKRRSYDDWANEKIRAVAPLARWQETADIADMVTLLSSARANQVTGQTTNVDSGQVMH